MSKLLVFCNDLDYFLRHRASAVEHLTNLGHDVEVVTGGREPSADERRRWRIQHTDIERFAFKPSLDFALLRYSLRAIRRKRPDSLHLITLKPAVFTGLAALLAKRLGFGPRRIVITIPGLGRLMSQTGEKLSLRTRFAQAVVGGAMRLLSRSSDVHFTFETAHDRDRWITDGLIRKDNSTVVNGAGVDPARFFPQTAKKQPGHVRILFASRLLKAKGLEAFLLAAEHLRGRDDIEFVVAGMVEPHDPDSYSLEELAKNPAISFLGEVTDMPALLRDVHIVCLPTVYGEGIPRILIEAAASGLPSIGTDTPGCRSIVVDGQTGLLIASDEAEIMAMTLATAVRCYLEEPGSLERHGRAALQHFLTGNYSQEAINNHFASLLLSFDKQQDAS